MMKPRNFRCLWYYIACLSFALFTSGCGTALKNAGSSLGSGLNSKADSIAMNLLIGVRTELKNPKTRRTVERFLDSIITSLNNTAEPKVKHLVGDIFNHREVLWADSMVEALTGKKMQANAKALQFDVIGRSTEDINQLKNGIRQLIDELLSDKTNQKIGNLRDQLLGPKTDSAISHIVDHATEKIILRFKNEVNTKIQDDIQYLGKYGLLLAVVVGVVALVIIFVVWWNKRRYAQMVSLLTKHIHNIPSRQEYDRITKKIKDEAITTGLEPQLRKVLSANGLIGNANWNSKDEG